MSQDEVTAIMEAKYKHERIQWEQTRTLAFYSVVAQQGTKNIKSPKDLFSLPWDEGQEEKQVGKTLTKEEFLEQAKQITG